MWLKATASRPISSSVTGSMRRSSSPREIAAAPSATLWTGREMRRATMAAARPPTMSVATVSTPSSQRVRRINASMRCLESPTRTVPHLRPCTMMGAAKSYSARPDLVVVSWMSGSMVSAARRSTALGSIWPMRSTRALSAMTRPSASRMIA